jgi:hypothetical protein
MLKTLGIAVLIAIIITVFVVVPWLSILAINHLFNTSIALTFWNWAAAFWLHLVVVGAAKS